MGLNTEERKTYLGLNNGKVTLRAKQDTPGVVSRTTKEGDIIYELAFDNITGYLTNIDTKEGKFGKQWMLSITDGKENFTLQFPYSGGYAGSFFKALPNVKLVQEIKFSPYTKTVVVDGKDKQRVTLYMNQKNGEKWESVKWAFTKEEPLDLPPMVQVTRKGKLEWDDSDQLAYFEKMAEQINMQLAEINKLRNYAETYMEVNTALANKSEAPAEYVDDINSPDDDGLPF